MVPSATLLCVLAAAVPALPQRSPRPTPVPAAVDASTTPEPAAVVLLGGFATQHNLTVADLGLGHGGFEGPERTASRDAGAWTTAGGALIQVAAAGIKVTYPAGGELLFTPTGFFHLRDGSEFGPFERGFELTFADESTLRVERNNVGRHPLGRVMVTHQHELRQLWDRGEVANEALRWRDHRGSQLLALGDGTALYTAVARGPVLFLERLLCPEAEQRRLPQRQILLHSDPLRESLTRLAFRYASPRGDFPQIDVLARGLTQAAPLCLPTGRHELRITGSQPLRIQLGGTFELAIDATGATPLRLGLRGDPASEFPLVEWTISRRQKLEVLRPNAVDAPGRRYYEQGMEVMRPDRWPLAPRDLVQDAAWTSELVTQIGGTRPAKR